MIDWVESFLESKYSLSASSMRHCCNWVRPVYRIKEILINAIVFILCSFTVNVISNNGSIFIDQKKSSVCCRLNYTWQYFASINVREATYCISYHSHYSHLRDRAIYYTISTSTESHIIKSKNRLIYLLCLLPPNLNENHPTIKKRRVLEFTMS